MADISRQRFIIARFADFCDHHSTILGGVHDPVLYLWEKLGEIEEPLYELKQDLLQDAVRALVSIPPKEVKESDVQELRHLLDKYLTRGDYADAFFHLSLDVVTDPKRREFAKDFLAGLAAQDLLQEERKPPSQRALGWDALVEGIYARLGLDLLETLLSRRPLDDRRLRFILRRLRRNIADYCAVLHVPLHPEDTFTPFILPRVEALVAAVRRFLRRLRTT